MQNVVFYRSPLGTMLLAADLPRQPPEAAANLLFRRQSRLDLLPVRRQCKLKIKPVSLFFHYIQFFEKRFRRILRPKHNRLNPPGRQLHPRNLPAVHRIADADKPFLQPVEKPFAVKCRNIRPPRHTENHNAIIARRRGEGKEGKSCRRFIENYLSFSAVVISLVRAIRFIWRTMVACSESSGIALQQSGCKILLYHLYLRNKLLSDSRV